ncbi:MAG TPA: translocation/assembly module TamB domain-containing protein [Terriglobia bacterium]
MTRAEGSTRRWKHLRVSRPVRVLVYLFGAALLLYLAAVAVLSTAWFQRTLFERTRAAIGRVTGARVEIGRMLIEPWVFQVTFRGLVLHGGETESELPLFVARELVIRLSPEALLHRRLQLRSVDLEEAKIHLYTRADGSTNLPGPATNAKGIGALDDLVDLAVRRLLVVRSDLYWDDRQVPLDLSARNVAFVLRFQGARYTGTVATSALNLSNPELQLPPVTVSTQLELAKNTLDLESLVWRSAAMTGSGTLALHWRPALESQFSFRLEGQAGPVARILRRKELQEGKLSLSGSGVYRSGAADVHGRAEGHRLVIRVPQFGPLPVEFTANYSVKGKRLEFEQVVASLLGGEARGKIEASLVTRAPSLVGEFDLQHFDLSSVLNVVPGGLAVSGEFPFASRVGGKIRISRDNRTAGVQAQFDLDLEAALQGREPLSGYARGLATLDRNFSLAIDEAALQSPHSTLKVNGQLGSAASLNVHLQTTDFEEWRKAAESFTEAPLPIKLESTASFSGSVSGALARPAIQGKLQIGAFDYQDWRWAGLEADVMAAPDQLKISSGRLLGAHSVLTLDLTAGLDNWKFTPDSPLRLTAHAQRTSIQALREVLGLTTPLTGELTGELELENTRTHLAGAGTLHIVRGSYAGETFDSLDASLTSAAGVWKLTHFGLVKDHGGLTGAGTYDPNTKSISAQAKGQNFSLEDVSRLQSLRPAGAAVSPFGALAGTLDFDVEAQGSIDNPSVQGTVGVRGVRAGDVALGGITSRLDWRGRQATVEGQLQGPGGGLSFHGTARTEGDWPVQLRAQYSGLRLDPWLRLFGLPGAKGNVDASGSTDFSGALRGSRPVELKSEVQKVEVSFAELKWQNAQPFTIVLEGRRLSITPFTLEGPSTYFEFAGTADLGPPSTLNLTANGEIDSAFLHVFNPSILTAGHFDMQVSVKGSVSHPSLYGSLHVDHVSVAYPGFPVHVAGLNGDVDLQGDRLTVRSLRSENGPASISITGSVTLSGNPRYSLRAELQHVRVDYPVQFTSVLEGSLHLSGTPEGAALSGDVTVAQMFVGENFNVVDWVSAMANQPGPAPPGTSSSLPISLDVHVGSAPVVSFESRSLTAVAAIDLNLRGTLADPVAFGNVHIQSGEAVLRQSTYTISRGDITLANLLHTEPVLDLEAKTRIQRYDLTLRVTGPADHPSISYRSDPPLSTPSILALLAFGYTSQDQLIAGNGRSGVGTQGASALLSQALSSQTSSRITRLFGLSRISIDPSPSSVGGTRVTIEEQLRRDFTITYVTTTGTTQERITQIEWNISDTMSLLGVRDQNGVYGLELGFRRRFK